MWLGYTPEQFNSTAKDAKWREGGKGHSTADYAEHADGRRFSCHLPRVIGVGSGEKFFGSSGLSDVAEGLRRA